MQHHRWIRFLWDKRVSEKWFHVTFPSKCNILKSNWKKGQIHRSMKLITSSPSSSSKYWYDAASEVIIDGKKKIEEEKKNDKESE